MISINKDIIMRELEKKLLKGMKKVNQDSINMYSNICSMTDSPDYRNFVSELCKKNGYTFRFISHPNSLGDTVRIFIKPLEA